MSHNVQNIAELIVKHLNDELSDVEQEALQAWLSESENNRLFFNKVISGTRIKEGLLQFQKTNEAAIWEKISKELPDETKQIGFRRSWLSYAAAAIVVLFISTATFFLIRHYQKMPGEIGETAQSLKNDVAPGGNKAVLTLADGSSIILDSAQNGALAQQGNTKVLKLNNGQLAYNLAGQQHPATTVLYNTISTPKGGQYQVVLPDGSKVWLNASSSLRFPTAFIGNERIVEITGEAYFEVASLKISDNLTKKRPFIVKVNGVEVDVMGTHFNVMAYGDEGKIKTTLLEGVVNVKRGKLNELLKPGQEAELSYNQTNDKIIIRNVDLEEAVAWKNGRFLFNNAEIRPIMRQLMRWYDVDVIYEGNVPERYFTANISRNTNLAELLKVFELSKIHFKIEGRKLIVMP
ncbi:MAG: FecR family protein [Bacteroidetes bacterium]|nr:FecR family protein [Bacteroidota bacterium]